MPIFEYRCSKWGLDFELIRLMSEEMRLANKVINYKADDTAVREDLGWQPRYLLYETVGDFIREVQVKRETYKQRV